MILLLALLSGCVEVVDDPVLDGRDADEVDLRDYLALLHADALARPRDSDARGRLAMAYHANGFDEAAATTYAQAAALDPATFRWPYLRALVVAPLDVAAAIETMRAAIALDGTYEPAWLALGNWLLEAGESEAAASAFDHVDDEALFHAASLGQARAALLAGDATRAAATLEPIIPTYPHPRMLTALARAYRQLGRAEEAAALSRQGESPAPLGWPDPVRDAIDAHIRGYSGRLAYAERLLDGDHVDDAAALLERLREEAPTDRTLLNNLAVAYGLDGRPDEAFEVFFDAIALHDDYYLLHYNLGTAYADAGDRRRAIQHFDRAIALQPGLVGAYERKAAALIADGAYASAAEVIDEATDHGERSPRMLFFAATIAANSGSWEEAIVGFRAVLDANPHYPRAALLLAYALAESGDPAAAAAALDRITDDSPAAREAVDDARRYIERLAEGLAKRLAESASAVD